MHDDVRKGKSMPQIIMLSLGVLAFLQATVTPQKIIPPCPCYSLQVSPEQQTVKIGEPININVKVTNTAAHDIYVDQNSRHPEDLYFVDVKDAKGVRQKMTDRYSDITSLLHTHESRESPRPSAYRDKNGTVHITTYRGSGEPVRTVSPGSEVKSTIRLNDLYSLDKAGTYTIQLKREEGKAEIDSNVVTVIVTN
jgi:hypothetical protein